MSEAQFWIIAGLAGVALTFVLMIATVVYLLVDERPPAIKPRGRDHVLDGRHRRVHRSPGRRTVVCPAATAPLAAPMLARDGGQTWSHVPGGAATVRMWRLAAPTIRQRRVHAVAGETLAQERIGA